MTPATLIHRLFRALFRRPRTFAEHRDDCKLRGLLVSHIIAATTSTRWLRP